MVNIFDLIDFASTCLKPQEDDEIISPEEDKILEDDMIHRWKKIQYELEIIENHESINHRS